LLHEAQAIETALRIVFSSLRGLQVNSQASQEAFPLIQEWAEHTAARLLRRWHIRSVHVEVRDVLQNWYLEMWSASTKYEAKRPITAFAYTILRRCCSAVVRREARNPWPQLDCERCLERTNWLDAVVHTEVLAVLQEAVAKLPFHQRHAVDLWLLHKEANEPLRFDSAKGRQRFHNLLFRACCSLKEILRTHFSEVDGTSFLGRAA
jgi:DNA-directed RNA polymerase specialized sigma24 family protein